MLAEEVPNEEVKRETLEVLAQMRDEAGAEYRRYREEMGIPGVRR